MHPFLSFCGITIPSYGAMIVLGVISALGLGCLTSLRRGLDVNSFIATAGYGMLGGIFGAKLLYILTNVRIVEWDRLLDPAYAYGLLHPSGFVVMGGLVAGLLFIALGSYIHDLHSFSLMQHLIFILPLCQGVGRIGCYLAGCCYGISYEGWGAVSFPHYSFAGDGYRFPVQLLSASILFAQALVLYGLSHTRFRSHNLYVYVLMYTLSRFFTEFLRGDDAERAFRQFPSQSQMLCMMIGGIFLLILIIKKCRQSRR